jgi:hypothetical protein
MIDLIALSKIERTSEATFIRGESNWENTVAGKRYDPTRQLPVLPSSLRDR